MLSLLAVKIYGIGELIVEQPAIGKIVEVDESRSHGNSIELKSSMVMVRLEDGRLGKIRVTEDDPQIGDKVDVTLKLYEFGDYRILPHKS